MSRTGLGVMLVVCALAAIGRSPSAAAELPFKVIVHPQVTLQRVDRATLSDIFLKRTLKWRDGTSAQPVDQSARSAVREAFSMAVHQQPVAAVLRFWTRQISEGRGVPPPVKDSDAQVVAYVASKAGAVGYVEWATVLPATVRVLPVGESGGDHAR